MHFLYFLQEIVADARLGPSWVREHVRGRVTDPIPHIRFGRYVRVRWGSPELEGRLAEHASEDNEFSERADGPAQEV